MSSDLSSPEIVEGSLCDRLAWCHPRVMDARLQRRFLQPDCRHMTAPELAVAIRRESITVTPYTPLEWVTVCPPLTGHFRGRVLRESAGHVVSCGNCHRPIAARVCVEGWSCGGNRGHA